MKTRHIRHIRRNDKRLGQILIEQGSINAEQLDRGLKVHRERNNSALIGSILMELGLAKEVDVLGAVTSQYSIPYIPLDRFDINPEAINMVSAGDALKYLLIPIDKIGNNLTIAMSNPLNCGLLKKIESIAKCNVQTVISTASDIIRSIDRYYYKDNNQENISS